MYVKFGAYNQPRTSILDRLYPIAEKSCHSSISKGSLKHYLLEKKTYS